MRIFNVNLAFGEILLIENVNMPEKDLDKLLMGINKVQKTFIKKVKTKRNIWLRYSGGSTFVPDTDLISFPKIKLTTKEIKL